MTMTTNAPVHTPRSVRASVFLPALGLIAAAATQIDAAIITNAYRSASPAPKDSLNFPWYGNLAGQISTWWAFADLFLVIGFGAVARSQTLRTSKVGRVGAWAAAFGAAVIVVANFLSAANANAMQHAGIGNAISAMFGGGTVLMGVGMTVAGFAVVRARAWSGAARFVPLANGLWSFAMIALIFGDLLQIAIGIMAALQVALGAALISQES